MTVAFFNFKCSPIAVATLIFALAISAWANAQNSDSLRDPSTSPPLKSLEQLKQEGPTNSRYRGVIPSANQTHTPKPRLEHFGKKIAPLLEEHCTDCHGPSEQEGNIRIDTLDANLIHGDDVDWWLEVLAVLTNGEMPPPEQPPLADADRAEMVQWLSSELHVASQIRRSEGGHSSFRRMTRYEYNFALQDLLGLPFNFAKDLPPEAASHDGFQNSSEMLHMSAIQFATYRESARNALLRATVTGERPAPNYWLVSMQEASAREWAKQDEALEKIKQKHKDQPEKLAQAMASHEKKIHTARRDTHYRQLSTGRTAGASWGYPGAKYAWKPAPTAVEVPSTFEYVAVIPPRQKLIVELGDQIPDRGTLSVRVRAAKLPTAGDHPAWIQLDFGWQASNDSHGSVRISQQDRPVVASPDAPEWIQWDIPLSEIYPRNGVRGINKLGDLPSPSEYVRLVNSSDVAGDIQIDCVEVTTPVYPHWPPKSHARIFFDPERQSNEQAYARAILSRFMRRAWRAEITRDELQRKLDLFSAVRPECETFQEAIIEVLAGVLSSPRFLYLIQEDAGNRPQRLTSGELATRLATFLWCSIPDEELIQLASEGSLSDRATLEKQVARMLADPKAARFSRHFVRQWLGMQLLDYVKIDRKIFPHYDPALHEAMAYEPVALFQEVLRNNHSILDFLHASYTLSNERLARQYGLQNVHGNEFRRVALPPDIHRGGLLPQVGLLAMNSDGQESHPLKRGIWVLENLLNDPPPPPPPAVPEIDLADPEIAKLSLKQRIERHRDHAACMSCHAKIDPWGIAFENFDALGHWRTEANGQPIDSNSRLFNDEPLNGMEGLKRYLLQHRQDQFARALVHKLATFALGRPMGFGDRASIDQITAELRQQNDGLATLIRLIVTSDLFQTK